MATLIDKTTLTGGLLRQDGQTIKVKAPVRASGSGGGFLAGLSAPPSAASSAGSGTIPKLSPIAEPPVPWAGAAAPSFSTPSSIQVRSCVAMLCSCLDPGGHTAFRELQHATPRSRDSLISG